MARTIDAQNWFDKDKLCDIIIKCDTREFKCHKFVLSTASEYFEKLVDPNSGFVESKGVAELKGDSPDAVEAVLRYIYSFEYEAIVGKAKDKSTPQYHLSVYTAAHKYQLPKLMEKAVAAMDNALARISTAVSVAQGGDDPAKVFELVKLLARHKDYHGAFEHKSNQIVQQHLAALFKLKAFRMWLEEDGNTAMTAVYKAVSNVAPALEEEIRFCRVCPKKLAGAQAGYHFCATGQRVANSPRQQLSYKSKELTAV